MISTRDRRRFYKAATVAFLGQHHRVRVGAALYQGSRFLSSRANLPGEVPNEPYYPGHAERRVIDMARPKSTLYVARLDLSGNLVASHPCASCWQYIRASGKIRSVVYFDGTQIRKVRV